MARSRTSRSWAASCVTVRIRGAGPARSIGAGGSPVAAGDEGLEDLPALQQLEGVIELRIGTELAFLDVGRRLVAGGRRRGVGADVAVAVPGLLLLEVPRQVGLAQQRRVRLVRGLGEDRGLFEDD